MKKLAYILIIVLIVGTIAGVATALANRSNAAAGSETFTIEVDGQKRHELKFEATDLRPGVTKEFTLYVKSEMGGEYTVKFDFKDSDTGRLNDYISVMIESDDYNEVGKLTELFGRGVKFGCKVEPKSSTGIKIKYFLDRDVGNEAQGEIADFDLTVELVQK